MRLITVKYAGDCCKCDTHLEVGAQAGYEKRVGLFCPDCMPTDSEEIREYRQEAGDKRAEKYEDWAEKRKEKANTTLDYNREHSWSDYAFVTQPGHIPGRQRVIDQDHRAHESLEVARKFDRKAKRLRKVRVEGDAEKKRQTIRDYIRPLLKVGMIVETAFYGRGTVARVNKKTAMIDNTGQNGKYKVRMDLVMISLVKEEEK